MGAREGDKVWLKRHGMATLTPSPGFPSLVGKVAGVDIKGSWWSHPAGKEIYKRYRGLINEPDVLSMKLIEGKVTLVHADFWPTLLSIVRNREWQKQATKDLDATDLRLLERVNRRGIVRLDELAATWPQGQRALKNSRRKLEQRGLVLSRDIHTRAGAHASVLESWHAIRERSGILVKDLVGLDLAIQRLRKAALGHNTTLAGRLGGKHSPAADRLTEQTLR